MSRVLWHNSPSEIEPLNGTNDEYWLGAMRWLLQEHGLLSTVSSLGTAGHFDGERAGSILVQHIHPDHKHRFGFDPDSVTAQEVFRAVQAGPRPFRFMDLPREIRDCVYEFAVVKRVDCLAPQFHGPPPPLLRTTRQLRDEASAIYYKENTFQWAFDFHRGQTKARSLRALERWAEAISRNNGKHLRRLRFNLCIAGYGYYLFIENTSQSMLQVFMESPRRCGPTKSLHELVRLKELIDRRKGEERWKSATVIDYLLADDSDFICTLEGKYWGGGILQALDAPEE